MTQLLSPKEIQYLRSLAARVAEIASKPEQAEKRQIWYDHNELKHNRPAIFCDPENGWHEIITKDSYICESEIGKKWEFYLRRELFWGEDMTSDKVIDPVILIPHCVEETGWGLNETKIGGKNGGSYVWDSPLKSYDDLDKLRFPEYIINEPKTNEIIDLANDVFGGILKIRVRDEWWWSLGITMRIIFFRGLEQMLIDMYDSPEQLHKLAQFVMEGQLHRLDYIEKNNLLTLDNNNTYVGSGGFGFTNQLPQPDFDGNHVRAKDVWGFAESQETVGVSPEMYEEFVFPYEAKALERFGMNYYGCCEPLDTRWHIVKKLPNLRRVSISAWADLRKMAENLEDNYVFVWKPNPAVLASDNIDETFIRKTLREGMDIAKDCHLEVIMKDCHTIAKNPDHVKRWTQIAMEEAMR